jgi:predicted outer membrane repeat protein
MNGSTSVSDNTASDGGGVYVTDTSTFTMSDNASVSDNTAFSTPNYTSSSYSYGGGVYVAAASTFTMNGSASVSHNTASTTSSSTTTNGGGVYAGGAFIMNGGTVYGSGGGSDANKLEGTASTKQGVSLYKDTGSTATAQYSDGSPIIAGTQTGILYTDITLTGH